MRETNLLGLRVAGVTAVILLVLFGMYWGGRVLLFRDAAPAPAPDESLSITDRTQDSDGDGVADLYETSYYNTDPQRSDTDGDGTSDLQEIIAGRDPLIPGPNDVSRPATGSQVTQLNTFTQRYLAALPEDVSREAILDQDRLESFVEANKGVLLPALTEGAVLTVEAQGRDAVGAYLDAVASSHNTAITAVTSSDIEAAFRLQVNSSDPEPMAEIVAALESNLAILQSVAAPTEVAALHTQMVQASQALLNNTQLVQGIQDDFVGGLIGARNIEELGPVFQDMAVQIQDLEAQYDLG